MVNKPLMEDHSDAFVPGLKRLLVSLPFLPNAKSTNAPFKETKEYTLSRDNGSYPIYQEYLVGRNGQPSLYKLLRENSLQIKFYPTFCITSKG
jgi:hypothetical protein